jgi:lysophospholipase L1-like esterase
MQPASSRPSFIRTAAASLLALSFAGHLRAAEPAGPERWETTIAAFEAADRANPPPQGAILFIGSSTIALWKTLAEDFPDHPVINRGFGGSQISDSVFYADRIVVPYRPRLIVLRAGGNDIHAGKTPEQVAEDFEAFVAKVRSKLPDVRIAYMPINATPARWANVEREKRANLLIRNSIAAGNNLDYIDTWNATLAADGTPRAELFVQDRLHFNEQGYKIFAAIVRKHLHEGEEHNGAEHGGSEVDATAKAIADVTADWHAARTIAPGIAHRRWKLSEPRPLVVNAVRVDGRSPGVRFHTTSRIESWENGKTETRRQTVRDYLEDERRRGVPIAVAINADAFSLTTAFDREDPTDILGLAVSAGETVSRPSGSPSLVVTKSGEMTIETLPKDAEPSAIDVAVSGFGLCLRDGKPLPGGKDLNPRTGFGLSQDRRFLFLMTIDGRQPDSAGATTTELGTLLLQAGAADGINMDGGGSTTLAWWNPATDAVELLNQPVGDGNAWPAEVDPATFRPTERTNGNNFGVSLGPSAN